MFILRGIWHLALKALLPFVIAAIRYRCRGLKYDCWQAGNCNFYGPPEFLSLCSGAMKKLSDLDKSLHDALVAEQETFWYEPGGGKILCAERHYGINDAFVAWGEAGVIACLVYEYFETKLVYQRPFRESCMTNRNARGLALHGGTRAWLEKHLFPAELIKSFNYGAGS